MANNVKRPVRPAMGRISYALMARFSESLICGRCFRRNVRKPVRQVFSSRHKPLPICHDCSSELFADQKASVLRFN